LLVVDHSTFVLENLANSALHRDSGEPLRRCVLRPGDSAQMQSESYRGFRVVIHELINRLIRVYRLDLFRVEPCIARDGNIFNASSAKAAWCSTLRDVVSSDSSSPPKLTKRSLRTTLHRFAWLAVSTTLGAWRRLYRRSMGCCMETGLPSFKLSPQWV
jgi:hypothetical protein